MHQIFPKGFEESVEQLLKVLNYSASSYSIEIFRYEGEQNYRARVNINHLAPPVEIEVPTTNRTTLESE